MTRWEQRQLGKAIAAARAAAGNCVNELSGHKRMGYRLPQTDDLLARFGADLPGSARRELREFVAEVRPQIEAGTFGPVHEAARNFGLDVGEAMARDGWAPTPKGADAPGESPTELAAQVPR